MASQAQRLLSKGVPVTLSDGREVRLRFDMRAVVIIEEQFDSLGEMALQLNSPTGPKYTALVKTFAAGLAHEGLTYDELLDLLDPAEVDAYDAALNEAFEQAFPQVAEDPNPEGEKNSPGQTGTSSPRSATAAQKKRSGE